MRKVKLLIWVTVLMLIDASLSRYMRIFNAAASLTYAFIICTAVREEEFFTAALIGGIGGILGGALLGRSFNLVFVLYAASAAAVFYLRSKPRYTHNIFKAMFWCGVLSAVGETVMYAAEGGGLSFHALYLSVLPPSIYNIAAAAVLYPLLERTVYRREMKKKLIV